ncbi:MAG TPA: ABC transporter substrate-binding protein [Candidatus Limnocylindria bacterium]|nr:ABC transporter substrate-binding protein [Candidatus Limnocylindria bacterium]
MADGGIRKSLRGLTALLAACAIATAPAAAQTASPRPPTFVIDGDPNSLDTIRNTPFGWLLGPLTQGYLFLVDDRGRLVPDRALRVPSRENGLISADGRTITYEIRTGRWSDGAPFDAHDVAFTVSALRNPRTSVPDTSVVAPIASVDVPRPDRLIVHLRYPWAPFVSSFLTLGADDPFAILPRHIAAAYASLDRSSLDERPVGLGPFRLARWERGERLEFERNPYAWRRARSARVVVEIQPAAQTRLVLALSREIDAVALTGLQVDAAQRGGLRTIATTTNLVDYLQLNVRRRPLDDVRVRRALAAALDRARLARTVYRSALVPRDDVQYDRAFAATRPLPRYDPAAAARVLAPLHLTLELAIAGDWRRSDDAAVQLAADLQRAGVTVRIRSYAETTFWGPRDAGGILESGRYDLALTSWSPTLDPERSYLFGCAAQPPNGGNSMGWCDRAYDREEVAGAAVYEAAARAAHYRAAGDVLASEVPVIPLGLERSIYAVTPRLRGFRPNPLARDFWNAWEWSSADTPIQAPATTPKR